MKKLTRRDFLKLSGAAAAAGLLAGGSGCAALKPSVSREDVLKFYPDAPSKVVHTHHAGVWTDTPTVWTDTPMWTDTPTGGPPSDSAEENTLLSPEALREMLDASITELTGLDKARDAWAVLFSPDERIAIKVNAFHRSLIWTHAPLVTAVTDSLQDAGIPPEQIVIFDSLTSELEKAGFAINEDGPGVCCYGTEFNYTQEGTVVKGRDIELSDILLECDALINMPVLKSHPLAGLTFAMKNHYGSIRAPAVLHNDIGNAMAELNALSPIKDRTRLIVGDALTACLRAKAWYDWASDRVGDSILLSFDPVAADTIATQTLGQFLTDEGDGRQSILLEMSAERCLESGAELGLGTNDPANMDLIEINLG